MRIDQLDDQVCPVARTVALVGDAWTLMIVRELFLGQRRFEDIRVQTGMSPQLLSRRLRELKAAGIIMRRPYQRRPTRFEFILSEKGLDLWPVIIALRGWGERWAKPNGQAPLIALTHGSCGHVIEPEMVCPDCGEPVDARSVTAHMADLMLKDRKKRGAKYKQSART